MLSLKDEMMKQEQYKDLLREAEKRALVRQALMGQEGHAPSVGRRLMAIVLQYFANLKCYLLEWYTFALKVPVQTPCQDAGTNQSSYSERR